MARRRLQLKILSSTPCTQSWSGMQGNERERHCQACDKRVHNFVAMSARQIEELMREHEGKVCARVTYHPDGSIQALDGAAKPSFAAGFVLASSIALAGPALGMAGARDNEPASAMLTGTLLTHDGSGPLINGSVILRANGQIVAFAKVDASGKFQVTAPPGRYEVHLGPNVLFGTTLHSVDLHKGNQDLQPLKVPSALDRAYEVDAVTGGVLVGTYRYPVSYLFKHPIRYLKHLPHNFS